MKDTTSEDYLDSLLNSIMNGGNTSSGSEDMDMFDDSVNDMENNEQDDFFGDIEDELFGEISDNGVAIIDDDDYFEKEISDEELFDLDEDIMSIIDNAPEKKQDVKEKADAPEPVVEETEAEKIHEIIKEEQKEVDVEDAIAANDSAVDDNLQGLLDVMGIDEKEESDAPMEEPKKKEKKKLFGKKKSKKASKEDIVEEQPENSEFVDIAELDFGGLDLSTDNSAVSPMDGGLESFGNFDFDMSGDDDLSEMSDMAAMPESGAMSGFGVMPDLDSDEPVEPGKSDFYSFDADDDFDEDEDNSNKKGKKGKKKKQKKEKKAKEKKVKTSNKATKVKKEKKKKEKEPDEIIKISKGFVLFAFTVVFVYIFSVIFGGDYYTYNKKVSDATKEYVNKNYSVAYDTIFGLEMKKDDDEELFNQIQTVMFVNRHYEAYESLIRMDEYEQGLYSLLKGIKMFDKYQNEGRKLNCYDDMQTVLGWIDRGLLETYGLTESQARELNLLNNDDKLAYEVAVIAQEAREKAEAEAKALEEAAKEAAKQEENVTE